MADAENHVFQVGDRVSRGMTDCFGTIIRFTEKRKDIVVKWDNDGSTERFDHRSGWLIGGDIWTGCRVNFLTPELEARIVKECSDRRDVSECRQLFNSSSRNLTPEKARKILAILKEEDTKA